MVKTCAGGSNFSGFRFRPYFSLLVASLLESRDQTDGRKLGYISRPNTEPCAL